MTSKINYWQETRSGIRSSTMIFLGALLAATSGLLQFGVPLIPSFDPVSNENLVSGFWLLWILSLWVLGVAFIWVGNNPFLTHFGTVVGVFHLIQGTFLLMILFTTTGAPVPPLIFTVGRLMTLLIFGLVERGSIGVPLSILLWVSSLLQLLKITLRVAGTLPETSPLVSGAVDMAFLLLICAALIRLGGHLRSQENLWAREKYQTRTSGFSDFNNPEHHWDNED